MALDDVEAAHAIASATASYQRDDGRQHSKNEEDNDARMVEGFDTITLSDDHLVDLFTAIDLLELAQIDRPEEEKRVPYRTHDSFQLGMHRRRDEGGLHRRVHVHGRLVDALHHRQERIVCGTCRVHAILVVQWCRAHPDDGLAMTKKPIENEQSADDACTQPRAADAA